MKPREDLFRLIRSLSPSEKSAFTKATSGNGDKPHDYVLLYQALERALLSRDCDEHAFLESPEGAPFRKHFSVKKAGLYDNILSVLRSRRQVGGSEKPLEFQIREKLEDAWLLKEKKLFEQSQRRLHQARKEAENYHFHEVLLEILKLQRALLVESNPKDLQKKIDKLHLEFAEITEAIENKFRMMALKDQIFVFVRKHAQQHGGFDKQELDKLMQEPELKDIARCKSFEAESNYHFCHAMYQYLMGNSAQAWIHARSQYLMWQEHKGVQRVKPVDYLNVLQNYLSFSNEALRYEDFDQALGQLVAGRYRTDAQKAASLHNALNVRLQKALNLCEWNQLEIIFAEYKKQRSEFSERLPVSRTMTFYLSFSRLFMVRGKWKEAIRYAKMVLDEGGADTMAGLVFEAHLQEMICHYMLDDPEEVSRKCRYIMDNFRRTKQFQGFEKRLLTIVKRLSESGSYEMAKAEFAKLLEDMQPELGNKRMQDSITRAWVHAIATGSSLQQVLEKELASQLDQLPPEARKLIGWAR